MDLVEQMDRIFYPRAVAVVGASSNPNKVGSMCMQCLVGAGFGGDIYPVNPGSDELFGLKAYPSVGAIPGEIDLAVIVIPAELTISALEECIGKGVKGVVVITGGFGEVGTELGADLQARMRQVADRGGIKIIGPNTAGLVNPAFNLNATFGTMYSSLKAGNAALVAQSGGMGAYISSALLSSNLGISKLIGLGNRCNLDFPEVLTYLDQDEQTEVIVMYLEGVEQPHELIRVAREMVRRTPIVVYKGGRGEESSRATMSHTGALAGRYEFYQAAFTQAGMIMVDSMTELVDMTKALAFYPPMYGERVAVVSVQAGPAIVIADRCRELGLRLAELAPLTRNRLRQLISPLTSVDNPVDVAWDAGDFDDSWNILDTVLGDDGVDAVIMSAFVLTEELMRAVLDIRGYYQKPVVVCLASWGELNHKQQRVLEESRIATYALPEGAANGLAGLVRYGEILQSMG